jgi:alkylation response protein AidB-like acyl-CoA dehydrogenase/flavin-dependent dehydrogenase/electron transfer flavoprotein alpha subunit/electron transfer flavoprotein alpha/beta subunit/ferredoxin-like protein FixX
MSDTAILQEFPVARDIFRKTFQMPRTAYNAPMTSWKYDVIIVGAGPAGITAAIALAKAQIPVLVIEAGVFPGAENWSGAVYFTENLAQPDVLGEQAVRDSAYERPVTKRGFYIYNGHSLVGLNYRNPATFANCYTVLRPTYDHYLAELAKSFGAEILTETTVDGLLRDDNGHIVGVHTDRGSIHADVVFLAEGDASQLVTKEGYERNVEPGAPHFLQGIKEVIEVDPDYIEHTFKLPQGEGAAFEILLRNGSIQNRTANLNMGGFLYTNKASLSLGLVLPLDNLSKEFGGDHNRLMEWFKGLPEVRRWTNHSRSSAYGAKIIRGGGIRELPQLVDNGLAIGGAATGIGLDFPYPNFTGPATAMGRLFANAVKQARADNKTFSRPVLEELYERPLRETHYFKNVEFLEKWPHYVEHTRVFFGRAADLATGSLYIASNASLQPRQKLWQLAKFTRETLPLKNWGEFFHDLSRQRAALGLTQKNSANVGGTSVARPETGEVLLEFRVDGEPQTSFMWPVSRLFQTLPSALATASDHVYGNDATPVPTKLKSAIFAFRRGLKFSDHLIPIGCAFALLVLMPIQWICELIHLVITRPSPEKFLSGFFQKNLALVRQRLKLDPDAVKIEQSWEEKLSLIRYFSENHSHIKVFRPENFENRAKIADSPLWHVCPAKVYECRTDDLGQSQLVVNFENCIKCETCWRSAPNDVDWTRQRHQRLIFSSSTESNRKLLAVMKQTGLVGRTPSRGDEVTAKPKTAAHIKLSAKLHQFCDTVYSGPRYIDAGRTRWLQSLLTEAQSIAAIIKDPVIDRQIVRIVGHAKRRKFFWAEADTRQLLEQLPLPPAPATETPQQAHIKMLARLDKLFPKQTLKDLEHNKPLSQEQKNFLRVLADTASLPRPIIMRELTRRDPSLAALVSGIYSAQVAARPELADQPWIGLTAARSGWKELVPDSTPTLSQIAADVCAIALGAGEMLLERCHQHATSRVQFPGLFKDEDGRDGIAKFGSVKKLLSEMEAQVYLLEALLPYADKEPALVKILAATAFGPDPGSLGYNAGQIFGGTAYSEDDVLSKFYRDSVCFSHMLMDDTDLKRQIGPDVETKLRRLALEAVKQRAVNPTELEAEIVKFFEARQGAPQPASGLGAHLIEHGYIEAPLQRPPSFNYREALKTNQEYDYGDFLVKPFDSEGWRFTPEMLHADTELQAYYTQQYQYFTEKFWNARFDGLPYYRLVEKLHMIPLADIRDMIARGFMRMYIPTEFGGQGLLKAHYYILCPLSMRYADPSYALTIMAHSSIGTTPILLGLNQDLPRAKEDLQQFLADQSQIENLKSEIARILRMLESPEALKVQKVFMALGEQVKTNIGKKPMLRAIASEFLTHFMDAGRAGLRRDLVVFKSELQQSLATLDTLRPRAEAVIAELDRRAEAHKLFLRLISAGQISAFALTEPNAGSDSGGVQTRAELKKVEVLTDADGVKYFLLGKDRKNLIDASTIDLTKIDYSKYDYKTDDPAKFRYYQHNNKRIPIHDIAQIRREGDKEFYEYYEVNGAKMWITNGHVAGVFCLYARTKEGPTGFMVDRHAEGLIVGKDEEKMGQRGSPTNELGLTSVRVPRENVIGIEGRGQVNALETLNVGRLGLCVSAVSMMAKIFEQTHAFIKERYPERQPGAFAYLGPMAAELYATESLAYELIGRADHHGTKSVRTESAIGKYYASEALHRTIRAAEKIMGVEGCTQMHELEKHRRDARVLNIYEGTNEVQRFLILRDLVDHVLPQCAKWEGEPPVDALGAEKFALARALKRAVDTFGAQVWQNANFQPTMFKLVDVAGYIKTMDSTLWRTEWLKRNCTDSDAPHCSFAERASQTYLDYARSEMERLHTEFDRDFALLKQGLYPPEVRVAFLALETEEEQSEPLRQIPTHRVTNPLHVLVVLNIVPVLSPHPRIVNGELLETHFDIDAASRTALERAIELKSTSEDVSVTAITVAPGYAMESLHRALALGADNAALIKTDDLPDSPHDNARLVADLAGQKQLPCDIVLCGDGILAAVLAGNLGASHFSGVKEFIVDAEQTIIHLLKPDTSITNDGPVVLAMVEGEANLDFHVDDYLEALNKPLEVIDALQLVTASRPGCRYQLPEKPNVEEKFESTPEAIAALVRKIAGIETVAQSGGNSYKGKVESATKEKLPGRETAVFLATPDKLEGLETAAACAAVWKLPFHVLVLGQFDEKAVRSIAARVNTRSIYFASSPHLAEATSSALLAALQTIWKDSLPMVLAAGAWANELLAQFARTFPRVQACYNVSNVVPQNGTVELVMPAFGGKVQRVATITEITTHPLVMTVAAGASGEQKVEKNKQVSLVPLEFEYDPETDDLAVALRAAHEEAGIKSIADAEFIIDVGYALRNKENFDLIITPLKKRLEEIGVKNVLLGGTRKVVEELKLLAPDQQIGQTGTAVNPKLIISIGVSGAPQHVDYIGERATIIAFNKDADAPLMTLNKRRARPKVVPIVGDLFELVPKFTAALKG